MNFNPNLHLAGEAERKRIAKEWFDLGCIVVLNGDKQPLTVWDQWQTQRQTLEEFESLPWAKASLFAIIMGRQLNNGLYLGAIDVDVKNLTETALAKGLEFEKHIRTTQTERTVNNGKHFLYLSRQPIKTDSKAHSFCGCEVLGEKKLCIMAPSYGYVRLNDNTPTELESLNEFFEGALRILGYKRATLQPRAETETYHEPHKLNIRPCVQFLLQKPHLEHSERLAIVTEYLAAGVKAEDIELMFQNQDDYDAQKTRYQIDHIEKGKYKPFTCLTLEDMNLCIPSCPNVKVRRGLELEPREPWKGNPDELLKEADHSQILRAYEDTIRNDDTCTILTFMATLLNYTKEEQQNLIFKSQSASGKTHIALEVTSLFPRDDVRTFYNVSPKAFWHEHGSYNQDTHAIIVDLEKQILVFLDQRNAELLAEMRAVLSHDKKVLETKIADRNRNGRHATKTVQIIGYPTFIFCSATAFLQEEDLNRALILSPRTNKEKLEQTLALLGERKGDPLGYATRLRDNPNRTWLAARIQNIKEANIQHIIIPEDMRAKLYAHFKSEHPALAPRHHRDYTRLLALVKAFALFNYANRTHQEGNIIATEPDVLNGLKWYLEVSESNELGIPPEIYELWKDTIQPCIKENQGIATREDIRRLYFQQHSRLLPQTRLKDALATLEATGLTYEIQHPTDKRMKVIAETTGPNQTQLGDTNNALRIYHYCRNNITATRDTTPSKVSHPTVILSLKKVS